MFPTFARCCNWGCEAGRSGDITTVDHEGDLRNGVGEVICTITATPNRVLSNCIERHDPDA